MAYMYLTRVVCGLLFLLCVHTSQGNPKPVGSATVGVIVPTNPFMRRSYASALAKALVKNKRNHKKLSAKYALAGKMTSTRSSDISGSLCGLLAKHSLSTIVICPWFATSSQKKNALGEAAKQQLPVIVWDSTGTTSETWKGISGLVLYLSPTAEQSARAIGAFADFAKKYGWQNVAVITDDTSGADEFVTELKKKQGKTQVIHYTYDPNSKDNTLTRALLKMKMANKKVLILYVNVRASVDILKNAAKLQMTGKSYLWIISQTAMPSSASNCPYVPPEEFPVGLVGMVITHSKSDALEAIDTAVTVWTRGLDSYLRSKPQLPKDVFLSKGTCKAPTKFKTGTGLYNAMLDSGSGDSKDSVIFSGLGTSSQAKFLIYNVNSTRKWEKVGNWTELPGLHLIRNTWPDGTKWP